MKTQSTIIKILTFLFIVILVIIYLDEFISCDLEIEVTDDNDEKNLNETQTEIEVEINACTKDDFGKQNFHDLKKVWSNCTVDSDQEQIQCCGPRRFKRKLPCIRFEIYEFKFNYFLSACPPSLMTFKNLLKVSHECA